jgi:transposase-like protein
MTVRYSPEFKAQVVKYVLDNRPTDLGKRTEFMLEVGKRFGCYHNTIYSWMPDRKSHRKSNREAPTESPEKSTSHLQRTLRDIDRKIAGLQKLKTELQHMMKE